MKWLCVAAAVLAAGSVSAAEFRSGQQIVVNQGEVLDDDLYAFGELIEINGEVQGDVIAFGREVQVPGHVAGDLIAAARAVGVRGDVDGTVRAASGDLSISGVVGKDAIVASGNLERARDATVNGDLAAAGGTAQLLGSIGRDVSATSQRLLLDGQVGGQVRARTESFTIGDHAAVEGPVQYSASRDARISEQARLGQNAERLPSERVRAGPAPFLFGWLRLSIGLFALGLLWRLLAPKLSRQAPATLRYLGALLLASWHLRRASLPSTASG
jgi:cytoskeletal protein CcmA (bactofilin family)